MPNLQDNAILTSLNTSMWMGRKYDRTATHDITNSAGANPNAGKFYKDLLAGNNNSLKAVFNTAMAARQYHLKYTCPWYNDGTRILPSTLYFDYTTAMREHHSAFDTYVEFFLTDYRQHYNDMALLEVALGRLFSRNDYPTPASMRNKFRFAVTMSQIPDGDWRTHSMVEDEFKVSNQIADIERAAVKDTFNRLAKLLHDPENPDKGFIPKLTNYTGAKDGSFRDSLFENLEEMCDLLPKLNITGDANLTATVNEVRAKLLAHSPDEVRDSVFTRATVLTEAQAILNNMAGYVN